MSKDFFKGIIFTLSIVFLISFVYAVGFHSAEEIFGGNFTGNFSFDNSVEFRGDVNFTKARLHGMNSQNGNGKKLDFVEFTVNGTHNFTVPDGVDLVYVTLIGAGGGGGGGHRCTWKNNYAHGGYGGYGGFASEVPIFVNPGENYTIVLGNPGTGGNGRVTGSCATAYAGTDGEATQFKKGASVLVSATGGAGGKGGRARSDAVSCTTSIHGAAGAGGTPTMSFYNRKYGNRGNRGIAASSGAAATYNGYDGHLGYARISWYS